MKFFAFGKRSRSRAVGSGLGCCRVAVYGLRAALPSSRLSKWRSCECCCTADQLPGPSAGPAATITEQELKQAYCSSVQALKDYLLVSQLTSYDITGRSGGLDQPTIKAVPLLDGT